MSCVDKNCCDASFEQDQKIFCSIKNNMCKSYELALLIDQAEEDIKLILKCVFCRGAIRSDNFSQMCTVCAHEPMQACRVCHANFPWYHESDLCEVCEANPSFRYPVRQLCQSCSFPLHPSLEYYCEDCYVRIHFREPMEGDSDESDDEYSDSEPEESEPEESSEEYRSRLNAAICLSIVEQCMSLPCAAVAA